MLSWLRGSRAQ